MLLKESAGDGSSDIGDIVGAAKETEEERRFLRWPWWWDEIDPYVDGVTEPDEEVDGEDDAESEASSSEDWEILSRCRRRASC